MNTHHSTRLYIKLLGLIALFLLLQPAEALAQQIPPEVARSGYADTLFINGKVVSMDDLDRGG